MRNEATESINISASCCIVIRVCGWRKIWLIHKIHNNIWRGRGLSKCVCVGGGRVLTRLRLRGTMLRLHRIQYGSLLVRHRRIVLYTTPRHVRRGCRRVSRICTRVMRLCTRALLLCTRANYNPNYYKSRRVYMSAVQRAVLCLYEYNLNVNYYTTGSF